MVNYLMHNKQRQLEKEAVMEKEKTNQTLITLSDKRLLDVNEFCIYASVGRNTALELMKTTGALFRVGRRTLVDRVKFDRWCDEHSEA